MERCWPGGATVKWNADGTPACAATAIRPDEGRKSFPSGDQHALCCVVYQSIVTCFAVVPVHTCLMRKPPAQMLAFPVAVPIAQRA
jgi:hypothetical protein